MYYAHDEVSFQEKLLHRCGGRKKQSCEVQFLGRDFSMPKTGKPAAVSVLFRTGPRKIDALG
jgi:hypothetical protein